MCCLGRQTIVTSISAMDKSGGSKADCSTFADTVTTIAEITKSVDAEQTILAAVDNGGTCADEGQPLLTDNKAAVVAAQADLTAATAHREGNRLQGDSRFLK